MIATVTTRPDREDFTVVEIAFPDDHPVFGSEDCMRIVWNDLQQRFEIFVEPFVRVKIEMREALQVNPYGHCTVLIQQRDP